MRRGHVLRDRHAVGAGAYDRNVERSRGVNLVKGCMQRLVEGAVGSEAERDGHGNELECRAHR